MREFVDIVMPAAALEGTESVVAAWLRRPGDPVQRHAPLLEISTDKVTVEIPAPASGVLAEIVRGVNDPVQPGDLLGRIAPSAETAEEPAASEPAAVAPGTGGAPGSAARLSPAVRRLIEQHQLDVSQLRGTGAGGRVTYEDVRAFIEHRGGPERPVPAATTSRFVPHTAMRRRIADRMVESLLRTAPHVTAVFEADLSAVLAHRAAHEAAFGGRGVRLTLTSYLVRAAVAGLRAVPEVNSRWHPEAIELFADCNIGVATALAQGGGLIVPVIREAQRLDLFETARRLQDLTARARAGRLDPADVQGGTFTITNHGVSGSLMATPIINQPESAILGVGKIQPRPVARPADAGYAVAVAPMAYVTLTIDHRVLDGAQANAFLAKVVETLEGWPSN